MRVHRSKWPDSNEGGREGRREKERTNFDDQSVKIKARASEQVRVGLLVARLAESRADKNIHHVLYVASCVRERCLQAGE